MPKLTTTVVATDTEGNVNVFQLKGEFGHEEAVEYAAAWLLKRDHSEAEAGGGNYPLTIADIKDHYDFYVTLVPVVKL